MNRAKIKSVLAVLLSVGLMVTGCGSTEVVKPLAVKTAVAEEKAMEASLKLTGVLVPNETVSISSKASGDVLKNPIKSGEEVHVGDLLIELDTKTLDAQIEQAKANLGSAQAALASVQNQANSLKVTLNQVEKTYNDTKNLYENGAVSESAFSEIESKYEISKKQFENADGPARNQAIAAVKTAEASINTLVVQRDNAVITSPMEGVVINNDVELGELVSPGMTLMTVADLSALKLKGTIAQAYLPYVKEGQRVSMTVDIYPDEVMEGEISSIGPMAVSTGKIFPIEITLVNDKSLLAGLSARTDIVFKGNSHVVVPVSALVTSEGKNFVYVINEGKAEKRAVVSGLKNSDTVEILTGLEAGEIVAISNTHIIQDQMTVSTADH